MSSKSFYYYINIYEDMMRNGNVFDLYIFKLHRFTLQKFQNEKQNIG